MRLQPPPPASMPYMCSNFLNFKISSLLNDNFLLCLFDLWHFLFAIYFLIRIYMLFMEFEHLHRNFFCTHLLILAQRSSAKCTEITRNSGFMIHILLVL